MAFPEIISNKVNYIHLLSSDINKVNSQRELLQ